MDQDDCKQHKWNAGYCLHCRYPAAEALAIAEQALADTQGELDRALRKHGPGICVNESWFNHVARRAQEYKTQAEVAETWIADALVTMRAIERRFARVVEPPVANDGLRQKYIVTRIDGKPVEWAFVLADTDPLVVPTLEAYAEAARAAGYEALAQDLEAKSTELNIRHMRAAK